MGTKRRRNLERTRSKSLCTCCRDGRTGSVSRSTGPSRTEPIEREDYIGRNDQDGRNCPQGGEHGSAYPCHRTSSGRDGTPAEVGGRVRVALTESDRERISPFAAACRAMQI